MSELHQELGQRVSIASTNTRKLVELESRDGHRIARCDHSAGRGHGVLTARHVPDKPNLAGLWTEVDGVGWARAHDRLDTHKGHAVTVTLATTVVGQRPQGDQVPYRHDLVELRGRQRLASSEPLTEFFELRGHDLCIRTHLTLWPSPLRRVQRVPVPGVPLSRPPRALFPA